MSYLTDKANLYLKLVKKHQDDHYFIHSDACDSLLFTALAGAAGMEVDLWAAHTPDGWERRPIDHPVRVPEDSKSSISRDMLLGVMWFAWAKKDLAIITSVLRQMNKGIMGRWAGLDGLSRVLPTPGLYATAKIIERTRLGKGPGLWAMVPAVSVKSVGGFVDHLTVLHAALRCLACGRIGRREMAAIKVCYDRNPDNPLFACLVKDLMGCAEVLNRQNHFPATRLPGCWDRRAPWLPERDQSEYSPDLSQSKEHTGMDFVFCLWVAKRWRMLKAN